MRWRDALELAMLDMCATALALGYAIGRIGCQVSGDGDYGIRSKLPWAMGYPHGTVPTPPGVAVQPTPIYETVTMGLVAFLLWRLRDRVRPGVVFALYCVLSGLERFLVEFVRRNQEVLRASPRAARERGLMIVGVVWLALMMRGRGLRAAAGGGARAARLARRGVIPRQMRRIPERWYGDEYRPRAGLERVFPLGSRVNERGRLEVGGCDTLELAREFGTPAYVVAEEDLRARARAFVQAARAAGHEQLGVVFASKAFPCTAVLALFAQEGLWCDVASGGELHLALGAGFAPERIVLHGNAKSEAELRMALRHGVGLIVIDNLDELDRLQALIARGRAGRPRAAGSVDPRDAERQGRHAREDLDGSGGLEVRLRHGPGRGGDRARAERRGPRAGGRARAHRLAALSTSSPSGARSRSSPPWASSPVPRASRRGTSAAGLGRYGAEQQPPSIEDYVGALLGAAREQLGAHSRLLIEPGRSLVANAGVTLYTVQSVKRNVSTWVAVDGGMSDNLRPMLYGAQYEAHVADRLGGETRCVLAGKHCESGDVMVPARRCWTTRGRGHDRDAGDGGVRLRDGAGYDGVPRPPVLCARTATRTWCTGARASRIGARDVLWPTGRAIRLRIRRAPAR